MMTRKILNFLFEFLTFLIILIKHVQLQLQTRFDSVKCILKQMQCKIRPNTGVNPGGLGVATREGPQILTWGVVGWLQGVVGGVMNGSRKKTIAYFAQKGSLFRFF